MAVSACDRRGNSTAFYTPKGVSIGSHPAERRKPRKSTRSLLPQESPCWKPSFHRQSMSSRPPSIRYGHLMSGRSSKAHTPRTASVTYVYKAVA